jgi:hypothetical protein
MELKAEHFALQSSCTMLMTVSDSGIYQVIWLGLAAWETPISATGC